MRKILVLIGLVLLFIAGTASALSLSLAHDSATVAPSTEGRVFVTIANDGAEKLVGLSARSQHLNVFFDSSALRLQPFETKGTYIRFSAVPGFKGVEDVDVYVEWLAGGALERASKTLRVFADGSGSIDSVAAPVRNYVPGTYGGVDGSYALQSNVESRAFFDPAQYDVDVRLESSQRELVAFPGELARARVMLLNKGAAGSFDVIAISGDEEAAVQVLDTPLSLQRAEAKTVLVDIQPGRKLQAGRYWFTLQVLNNGYVVAEREMYFDVQDRFDALIKINSPFNVQSGSQPVKVQATLQNTGTVRDTYALSTSSEFATIQPARVTLNGGDKLTFDVVLDTGKMKEGENTLDIRAESAKVQGSGVAQINLKKAPVPVAKVEAELKNNFGKDLSRVTASIENIPSAWEVLKPAPINLKQGESATLTLMVRQTTAEDALNPVLVIRSGDTVLERRPLPSLKASALSGLFTAGSNITFAGVLIAAAMIVALMVASRKRQSKTQEKEQYDRKLRSIREALQRVREA